MKATCMESNSPSHLLRVAKIVAIIWAITCALICLSMLLSSQLLHWYDALGTWMFLGLLPAGVIWSLALPNVGFVIRAMIVAIIWAIACALLCLSISHSAPWHWHKALAAWMFIGVLPVGLMWLLGAALTTITFLTRSKLSAMLPIIRFRFPIISDPSVRNVVLLIMVGIISTVIAGLILALVFSIR